MALLLGRRLRCREDDWNTRECYHLVGQGVCRGLQTCPSRKDTGLRILAWAVWLVQLGMAGKMLWVFRYTRQGCLQKTREGRGSAVAMEAPGLGLGAGRRSCLLVAGKRLPALADPAAEAWAVTLPEGPEMGWGRLWMGCQQNRLGEG